jgi:hypothetical protein
MSATSSTTNFNNNAEAFSSYFRIVTWSISFVAALAAIELMRRTQGFKNKALLLFLLGIVILSLTTIAYESCTFKRVEQSPSADIFESTSCAVNNALHYMISRIYIVASFETRMLIDKDTYIYTISKLVSLEQFRRQIRAVSFLIGLLIITISTCYYFGLLLGLPMLDDVAGPLSLLV